MAVLSTNAKSDDRRRIYCSLECKNSDYEKTWEREDGTVLVFQERDGFECDYVLEHRVVASRLLGRQLAKSGEPIIHLDGDAANNSPENLYVCTDYQEMQDILNSKSPWPSKSNLGTPAYK